MAWIVKGSGSAEFRGKNSCRVEFQMENTATGEIKRERKTMPVNSKTKKEKERCKREFRAELESGLDRDERFTTFGEYAERWLAMRKANPQIAVRTYSKEVSRVKNMNLHFKNHRITEITRMDVKDFQLALMTTGEDGKAKTVSGKPLSGTTARGVRTTFRQILQEAVEDGIIAKNPCDGLKAPSVDTEEKEPLTPEEVARFKALLDASRPRNTLVAYRIALFAGLRRGEICALRWSDFNIKEGTLTVSRSLCSESLEFKETKTEAGMRIVPLDKDTIDYLVRFKAAQSRKLMEVGLSVDDACIVAKAGTNYMHPENLTKSLGRFAKAYDFEGVTPHVLRHTYCTMLFATGTDLKTAQYLMGHDDPSTTLKIYTHYVKSNGVKAVEAVSSMVNSLPTSNVIELDQPKGRWGISAVAV